MEITAHFSIMKWQEENFSQLEGAGKLTCASVAYQYQGPLEGSSEVKYIMAYDNDGRAVYQGFERVIGTLEGRSGSFVLQHHGVFEAGKIDQQSVILENSGSGDLTGISGSARLQTGHADSYNLDLSYQLPG